MRRSPAWWTVGTIVVCTLVAWHNRFVQDDAFISFRYADHLAHGHGLVWNVGEHPIEGFTNMLWTLLLGAAIALHAEPVTASYVLGVGCFAITLGTTRVLVRALTGSEVVALAVVVTLGANVTFSAYATSGLETQSQAMFVTLTALFCERGLRDRSVRAHALASAMAGAALWTRLDSVVVCGALVAPLAVRAFRESGARDRRVAIILPGAIATAALFALKWIAFGTLVPNTYYAKVGVHGAHFYLIGADYVLSFFGNYSLLSISVLAVLSGIRAQRAEPSAFVSVAVAAVALWLVYVVKVGSDFMEYRFFVPILPLGASLVAWSFSKSLGTTAVCAAAAGAILGSLYYLRVSKDKAQMDQGPAIETLEGLTAHVVAPDQNWKGVGTDLGEAFDHDERVTIAVMAAGAIPYYSRLRTIDMLGLSDAWIARHGVLVGERPGHQRSATLEYLVEQSVNLVVHPWARGDGEQWIPAYGVREAQRYLPHAALANLPADAEILEIPIAGRNLRMLYLVRSAIVDEKIRAHAWRTIPIMR